MFYCCYGVLLEVVGLPRSDGPQTIERLGLMRPPKKAIVRNPCPKICHRHDLCYCHHAPSFAYNINNHSSKGLSSQLAICA